MPASRLVLTHKGTAYELTLKGRTNEAGEQMDYWAADSLQSYVTKLYRDAGLRRGYSSHSGRRTFANRLLAQGQSLETIQTLLGHADHISTGTLPAPAPCWKQFLKPSSRRQAKPKARCCHGR